jgi:tetratricopeptide (TPR) repeat protein
MAKIGRNQPCPCGSGRKYKACHLRLDEEAAADRRAAAATAAAAAAPPPLDDDLLIDEDGDELCELSNHAVDLIHDGRLDEAEAECRELMRRFPGAPDGLARLGHVFEKRGDHKQAADCYRQAAAIARRHSGAEEHAEDLEELAERFDPRRPSDVPATSASEKPPVRTARRRG